MIELLDMLLCSFPSLLLDRTCNQLLQDVNASADSPRHLSLPHMQVPNNSCSMGAGGLVGNNFGPRSRGSSFKSGCSMAAVHVGCRFLRDARPPGLSNLLEMRLGCRNGT